MNAKKLFALLLAVVMVVAVFAGCNNEPAPVTTAPTAAPTTAPTEGDTLPTKPNETPKPTTPVSPTEPESTEPTVETITWICPVSSYKLTSPFGMRKHPIQIQHLKFCLPASLYRIADYPDHHLLSRIHGQLRTDYQR
jgi:hypothetical protein